MMKQFDVVEITYYSVSAETQEKAVEYVKSVDFNPLGNKVQNIETVEVLSGKDYQRRKDNLRLLACLEAAGVDNWSGYSMAYEAHEGVDPF